MALQTANNAICTLQNPIQEDSTVIFLAGNYNRLPTSNFIVEIATFGADNETVIARENIFVASRTGNQLIVGQRACEPVPIDDNASENIQQALAFDVGGTVVKQVISKKLIDEIQKGISDINQDLEDNYLTVQDYENEKGQPGGIATLGNDGKIPSSQIDSANLDVNSINYEFTAGESISAGDLVSTYYTLGTTENSATLGTDLYFSFYKTSDYNNRYQTILTHTLTANQNYITKVTLDYVRTESNNNYAASGVVMIRNRGRLLGQANYGRESGAITININSIVVGDIEVYIYCSAVYNYTQRGRFDNVKLFSKVVNSPGRICKASSSTYKLSSYIGIAINSGTSGSKIKVKNYGVVNYNGVKSGVTYGQRKGQLIYGTGVGVGIATNVLFLYNKINIDIINLYFAVSLDTTYQVTIQHNLGTVPLGIYDVNFNLIETIIEKTSQDFTIELDQNSPQTGYNFKFYVIG